MNEELFEFVEQATTTEVYNYIINQQEDIDKLIKENEELKRTIDDYIQAMDNLADTIGEATGDLVGDELIDY